MTTPGAGDAAMSFDSQSVANNQGIKDLSIKSSLPDGVTTLQTNDVAHLKNSAPGVNGSDSSVDSSSKPQETDINLPTPADSAVDSTAPAVPPLNGVSAPVLSAMEIDQPAVTVAPEDPAVQQPTSESREPVEPVSQEEAAEIQAQKVSTDPLFESTSPAAGSTHAPVEDVIPTQAEPPAPAAAVTDAMDTSDVKPAQAIAEPVQPSEPEASALTPAVDLPHHPSGSTANDEIAEKPADPAPTPAVSAPAEVKTETAPVVAPLPTSLASQDVDMKDAPPPSPGKLSRSREDDSAAEEPEAKRMRPSAASPPAAGSPAVVAGSPANVGSPASSAPAGERDFSSPITEPQHKALATVIANTKRSTHAAAFSRPVDYKALNIPTYPEVIKEPMDLGTMNEKVKLRQYPNVQAFVADFNLIVSNCEKFNGSAHAVTQGAHKLRETFEKQLNKVPGADFVEPPPPEKKKKITAPRAPARRESRVITQPVPKTAVAPSPTTYALNPDGMPLIRRDSANPDGRPKRDIHPPASKDLPYSARPKKKKYQIELRFCSHVLHELDRAKFNHAAWPFKVPVDPVALNIPNYHKIIKKPMDLSTMRKKLDAGQYENAKDFENDMRLIFSNCYKFNQKGDAVFTCGENLEHEFTQEWAKKGEYIRQNAPDTGVQSTGSSPEVESDEDEEEDDDDDEDDDEGVDQIAKLQSQIAAMSEKLSVLTKTKKKKKSPPAPAKKKGGKKETKKAEKKSDKKASKKKGGSVPYVSYEQKQDISNRINTLPEARMIQALDIIKANMPSLKGAENDELELDIDELSNDVLYKLLQFVRKYAPKPDDEPQERRQSYAPTQSSKPKKNKPMGAREQENRIEQLRRIASGEGLDNGAAAESSGDDDESDDESEEE